MEAEIRKTARGSARMSDFEHRLATDMEARIERENKMAKTGSAIEGETVVAQDACGSNENGNISTSATPTTARPDHQPASSTTRGTTASTMGHRNQEMHVSNVVSSNINYGVSGSSSGAKRKADQHPCRFYLFPFASA